MADLINRQAAIDALEKVAELYPWRVLGDRDSYSQYNEAWQDALNRADSEIEALPSAQTERERGHWVEIGDEPYDEWECDVCGFVIDGSGCIDPEEYRDVYKFCPNCGADMRKREGDNV
jgi:rubredoxin